MKSITIVSNAALDHQSGHGACLGAGLEKHGYSTEYASHTNIHAIDNDLVACWGWRIGVTLRQLGHNVLVMERGYIGDRKYWTSLGWNGLNGNATWPKLPASPSNERRFWDRFRPLVKAQRLFAAGKYILIIGQVPGDASLGGRDMRGFYRARADELFQVFGLPIMLRPHPLDKRSLEDQWAGLEHVHAVNQGSLDIAFSGAAGVVCFNSNTAVDAVLAGLPTETHSQGSMVWDLCRYPLQIDRVYGADYMAERHHRLEEIAWRQWTEDELRAGLPWARFGPPEEHGLK